MFALVADESSTSRPTKRPAGVRGGGLRPVGLRGRGRPVPMPYWQAPERLFDEPDEFAEWARALAVAVRRSEGGRSAKSAGKKVAAKPKPRQGESPSPSRKRKRRRSAAEISRRTGAAQFDSLGTLPAGAGTPARDRRGRRPAARRRGRDGDRGDRRGSSPMVRSSRPPARRGCSSRPRGWSCAMLIGRDRLGAAAWRGASSRRASAGAAASGAEPPDAPSRASAPAGRCRRRAGCGRCVGCVRRRGRGAAVAVAHRRLRATRLALGPALAEGSGALVAGLDFHRRDRLADQLLDAADVFPVERRGDGDRRCR